MKKVGLISLGCAKNRVDSEIILAMLQGANIEITNNLDDADVVIINTCGFIKSSQDESFEVISSVYKTKKQVLIAGCLVKRFEEEIKERFPNAFVVGISNYDKLHLTLEEIFHTKVASFNPMQRVYTTLPFSAYLRISEGCNNNCAFCAIPLIRGRFRSRPLSEVVKEAQELVKSGKKEIVIISQDTTRYGSDLEGDVNLLTLLKELVKIKGIVSLRLLYLYPKDVTFELVNFIASNPLIAPYFDLPFQHAGNKVLRSMYRRDTLEYSKNLINYIRLKIPHAIIRTTFIVGFPGETEDDFKTLLDFIKEVKFNHLGVFTYSRELGTKAYDFTDQVPEDVKNRRKEIVMETQKGISLTNNINLIGRELKGFITSYNTRLKMYEVRTYFSAPDNIDGTIFLRTNEKLSVGDPVLIKITKAFVYDLEGTLIKRISS